MNGMERDSTIWQIVLTKYPRTAAERKCINERKMMDRLRERYYNQLYDGKREIEILGELGKAKADN
jgi:phage pi2 protein 07